MVAVQSEVQFVAPQIDMTTKRSLSNLFLRPVFKALGLAPPPPVVDSNDP